MTEWTAGLLFLLVVPLLFGLMYLGWRRRGRGQTDVPAPAAAPPAAGVGEPLVDPEPGTYVSTVRAGDWLDRVVVHGLGVRSAATLHAGRDGVWLERQGARSVWVPAADLLAVRTETGIAGKYTVGEGLLVLRWRCGDAELDTGFRPRRWATAAVLAATLQPLVPGGQP